MGSRASLEWGSLMNDEFHRFPKPDRESGNSQLPGVASCDDLTVDLIRKAIEKSNTLYEKENGPEIARRTEVLALAETFQVTPVALQAPVFQKRRRRGLGRVLSRAFDPIRNFEPTRRHQIVVITALIFVLRPWLIPALVVLTLAVCAIVYLSLGPDRVNELGVSAFERLKNRRPETAEAVRLWAVSVSKRLASVVRILPDRWTDGLYLPDFEAETKVHEKMQVDPFEKLAAQVRNL